MTRRTKQKVDNVIFMPRVFVAASILGGMIASPPLCDRTKINKNRWARIALEWADVLLEEGRKP